MDNTDLCNTQILRTTLAILKTQKTQDDSNSIQWRSEGGQLLPGAAGRGGGGTKIMPKNFFKFIYERNFLKI